MSGPKNKKKVEKPVPEYVYEKHTPETFKNLNHRRQIQALLFKVVELETRLAVLEADKANRESHLIVIPGQGQGQR